MTICLQDQALDLLEYAKTGNLASLESGHNLKFDTIFAKVSVLQATCNAAFDLTVDIT